MGKAKPQTAIYLITCSFFYLVCSYFRGTNSLKRQLLSRDCCRLEEIELWTHHMDTTHTVIAKISGMPLPQNKYIFKKTQFCICTLYGWDIRMIYHAELVTYHITAVTSWDLPKEFGKCWLSLPPISPPLQWQHSHLGWVVALRFQRENSSVWAIGSSHWNQCNVCARSRIEKFRTVVLFYFYTAV